MGRKRKADCTPGEWAASLAYRAAWAKANPERVKAYQAAKYAANPEKVKARASAWAKANPEKVRAKCRAAVRRLSNKYVRQLVVDGSVLRAKDVPQVLVEAKRLQILIKRHIKEQQNEKHD